MRMVFLGIVNYECVLKLFEVMLLKCIGSYLQVGVLIYNFWCNNLNVQDTIDNFQLGIVWNDEDNLDRVIVDILVQAVLDTVGSWVYKYCCRSYWMV